MLYSFLHLYYLATVFCFLLLLSLIIMSYLGDRTGFTSEQTTKVLQFQVLTGVEDISICRDALQRYQWNLEVAIQEHLNIKEGRPSVYAREARPPAIVHDDKIQRVFYCPPSDGSASGIKGLICSVLVFLVSCYTTFIFMVTFFCRLFGAPNETLTTNSLEDVLSFIYQYDEEYTIAHPVFYQGTHSQVLNDAKQELKFLLIYLHNDDAVDTRRFCYMTLANNAVIDFINEHFIFWACSIKTDEGVKVSKLYNSKHYPYFSVVVLKEERMTIVCRMEGFCSPDMFHQRLRMLVCDFEDCLVSARHNRMHQSLIRSLRAQQDEAYNESLRVDQENDRRRDEERRKAEEKIICEEEERRIANERKMNIVQEKIDSVTKVPEEPDKTNPNAVHVIIKLPCGMRLERRFLTTHSLEAIFYFVFCHPSAPDSFEITRNFPKRVLHCRKTSSKDKVQTIEEADFAKGEVLFVNDLDA